MLFLQERKTFPNSPAYNGLYVSELAGSNSRAVSIQGRSSSCSNEILAPVQAVPGLHREKMSGIHKLIVTTASYLTFELLGGGDISYRRGD
jgi:hypothetical protein